MENAKITHNKQTDPDAKITHNARCRYWESCFQITLPFAHIRGVSSFVFRGSWHFVAVASASNSNPDLFIDLDDGFRLRRPALNLGACVISMGSVRWHS